ncbi:hypothetical protein Tco_1067810 [Tanacetum coccineum]|uniref:Uncharacterized protein n=1 Tax=Tanacetum coccineum TaxID=301880 RepID=A0ABQ5HG02_9ASTR
MTPPLGFSALAPIPGSKNELPPITTSALTVRSPANTPLAFHVSTSANPGPMISHAFIDTNYEVLESLLRERKGQMRNEDLPSELDYFSKEYDKEREMESRSA